MKNIKQMNKIKIFTAIVFILLVITFGVEEISIYLNEKTVRDAPATLEQLQSEEYKDEVKEVLVHDEYYEVILKNGESLVYPALEDEVTKFLTTTGLNNVKVEKVKMTSRQASLLVAVTIIIYMLVLITKTLNKKNTSKKSDSKTDESLGNKSSNSIVKRLLFGNNRPIINKSKLIKEKPTITFDDIGGGANTKIELKEIVDFLKNPEKYKAVGARMPSGVLLEGAPGLAKTMFGKAVANESDANFYYASGSEFDSMYVGTGSNAVRDLFNEARKNQPAIIFIDEIDSIAQKRSGSDGNGVDQTTNQLLVEMDGFKKNTRILVMAATNRKELLDPGVLRPGRFTRTIKVTSPTINERKEILKIHAKNKPLSPNVDLDDLATQTSGYSGASLENLLNEAAILTVRDDQTIITNKYIKEAEQKIMLGSKEKHIKMSPKEKLNTAYHEGGHALIGMQVLNKTVSVATILPRNTSLGHVQFKNEKENEYSITRKELFGRICYMLAGRIAEEYLNDDPDEVTAGARSDFSQATETAYKMVFDYGMSNLGMLSINNGTTLSKSFKEQVTKQGLKEVTRILKEAEEKTRELIYSNGKYLDLIAEELLEKEELNEEEFRDFKETKLKGLETESVFNQESVEKKEAI